MSEKIAVICINDKNRPTDFPESLWVVADVELYHVVGVNRMARQPGVYGFRLEERDLSSITKYDSFDSRRFRPATDADLKLMEELEELMSEVEDLQFVELLS